MSFSDADTFLTGGRGAPNAWSPSSGSENWAQVVGSGTMGFTGTQGTLTNATTGNFFLLGSSTVADAEATVEWQTSAVAADVRIILRSNAAGTTFYCLRHKGATNLFLTKVVSSAATDLPGSPVSFGCTNNTLFKYRFRAQGSNLFGKVWASAGNEPAGWTITATDGSITGPGQFGVGCVPTAVGQTISFDNYTVAQVFASGGQLYLPHRHTGRIQ